MLSVGYWISIGCACCISGIYFYCTMRRQRCYYDDEVEDAVEVLEDLCSIFDNDDDEYLCLYMLKWWVFFKAN